MKKLIKLLQIVAICCILLQSTAALDECGDSVATNQICTIRTPVLTCGTYTADIYNSSGSLFADDRALSQISTSQIYNFSVNFTTPDTYTILLACDDASRSIIAVDADQISPTPSWWSYILMIYFNTLPGAW